VSGEVGSEKTLEEELAAKGLVDPKEDLLPLKLLPKLLPKLLVLFWKRGLPNGDPWTRGLPRPERGELL
jgi:hypothetical protein